MPHAIDCHSGSSAEVGSHLGSVAQELHRAGVPAVVASRLRLSQPGSVLLTQVLYPLAYGPFLEARPWMVGVAAVRNVAIVVLLAGAVWRLAQIAMSRPGRVAASQ